LLGAVNAAVGVVASAAGLAIVPIDRAATLRAGLTGIVYSLPELRSWTSARARSGRHAG